MPEVIELSDLPEVGVGINYQKSYHQLLQSNASLIDFVEFNPDSLCTWQLRRGRWELGMNKALYDDFIAACQSLPKIAHGLSLSIGSASGWNQSYINLLNELVERVPFAWHSEHLGFLDLVTPQGTYMHAGTQLPMPFTKDALDLLVPRIQFIIQKYKRPFLLENTTYYVDGIACEGMDEIDFLNALCKASGDGCGLLLDLHNFYCNSLNFGFDAKQMLSKLDFSRVVEIHLAGGVNYKGYQLDVHSNTTPEPVWDLLAWVLPRARNAKAIVFELLEQALGNTTPAEICNDLQRAKNYWAHTRQNPGEQWEKIHEPA